MVSPKNYLVVHSTNGLCMLIYPTDAAVLRIKSAKTRVHDA